MPARKYLKKHPARAAVIKSIKGEPYKGVKVAKKDRITVPRNLRGIKNQNEREKAMIKYLENVPDSQIDKIFKSYPLLEKTADGETFAQAAAYIRMMRRMNK